MRSSLLIRTFAHALTLTIASGAFSASPAKGAEPPLKVLRAWAEGPFETRIALNRAVEPESVSTLSGESIAYVYDGLDESPPASKDDALRGTLHITAVRLVDGGTTVAVVNDPYPGPGSYTLALSGLKPKGESAEAGADLRAVYTLDGFEVVWEGDAQPAETAKGWLPGLDFDAYRTPNAGTAAFEPVLAWFLKPGKITFSTQIRCPKGTAAVALRSSREVEATLAGEAPRELEEPTEAVGPARTYRFPVESADEPLYFTVGVPAGPGLPLLSMSLTAAGRGPSPSTLLPWVFVPKPSTEGAAQSPKLDGGDPALGKAVFQGATAKCSTCHKVRGEGGTVGPDLSGFVGRDRLWVYREIAEPSRRIHPDYLGYTVATKDGGVLVGTVRSVGADAITITNTEAKATTLPRDSIEDLRPSATSIMPVGLIGAIGEAKVADLIAYLVTEPNR